MMKFSAIVAFCKGFGIGFQDKMPWSIPEDMEHFKELTDNSIVIMGRKTYFSIPEKNRPLKNRVNIVLTNNPKEYEKEKSNDVIFITCTYQNIVCASSIIGKERNINKVFIIGGESIYREFLSGYCNLISKLYVTYIDKEYQCDKHFTLPKNWELSNYSELFKSKNDCTPYRYMEYIPCQCTQKYGENQYTELLQYILLHGNSRDDRTNTGTVSVFGRQIRFDISKNLPILTTKFVPFKMIVKELLWFLQGQTDNKILQDQGVHIWDGNTTREFLDKRGLINYKVGDIGPMYGFNWRHFGAKYEGCDKNYDGQGIDQLENVINLLKTDPYSRRIAMTTYNVSELDNGVLQPCHGIYVQFYVENRNGNKQLSCHMTQRSVDCGCGLPFNITSYAILTYIIAQKVDMIPSELIISTGDTHIYNNHLEPLKQQIERTPYPLPKLSMTNLRDKPWNQISVNDFELVGYFSHPAIKLVMSI